MKKLLENVTGIEPDGLRENCSVIVDKTKIVAVTHRYGINRDKYEVLPGTGLYAFPGFIDLHVHSCRYSRFLHGESLFLWGIEAIDKKQVDGYTERIY